MNIFDNVVDDYNDLLKQINTIKFKINNEFVIKNDVIVFAKNLSMSIKNNVKTSINASINVVMTKFQNNINSINSVSKFVKSSQKISAINVFASHRNQIFIFAIQSFDQQIARNIQYEFSNFRSFQKIRKRRSFDADILHQNDKKFSFFFLIRIEIHFCTIICNKSTFTIKLLKNVSFVLVNAMITFVHIIVFVFVIRFCHQINLTNFVTWCWSDKINLNLQISIFFTFDTLKIKISSNTWLMKRKWFILAFNCLFKQSNNTWSTTKMFWNIYICVCAMSFKYDEQIKILRNNSFYWSRLIRFAMY